MIESEIISATEIEFIKRQRFGKHGSASLYKVTFQTGTGFEFDEYLKGKNLELVKKKAEKFEGQKIIVGYRAEYLGSEFEVNSCCIQYLDDPTSEPVFNTDAEAIKHCAEVERRKVKNILKTVNSVEREALTKAGE